MAWYRCGGGGSKPLILPLDFIQLEKNTESTALSNVGGVLSVTYNPNSTTASGGIGYGIFATSDFYNISKYSYILVTRASKTSDTRGQQGKIYLINEGGTKILLDTVQIPSGFTYARYIDISGYKGKYKIGLLVNTGTYTYGYGTASGSITVSDFILV